MYLALRGEMIKKQISISQLAFKIGISEKSLRNKINGITEFTWSEVKQIHKLVNPELSIDELFTTTSNK